ncbi:MAG TPA: SMC-Scp complex subunit ScpB [Candidatus Paceibacterota bacterium]|nr:SMC-Scp complex subunit ScpB [Candidatus Paceibacterota bacterium]
MNEKLQNQIESILFWKSEPVTFFELAKLLSFPIDEIKKEVTNLSEKLSGRGVVLVSTNDEVCLMTSPENSELISKLQKEELSKDLSRATIETLSIILYRGPIKRSEIDYIRGVNSQFTIRNLLIRGLISKITDPKDERVFLYQTTIETLAHMGLQNIKDLPDYSNVNSDIDKFLNQEDKNENVEKN